jgi:peptidyl-tRNA hydrolase
MWFSDAKPKICEIWGSLKTEKALVYIYQTTRRHVQDHRNFNIKQRNVYVVHNDMKIHIGHLKFSQLQTYV